MKKNLKKNKNLNQTSLFEDYLETNKKNKKFKKTIFSKLNISFIFFFFININFFD